MDSLTHGGPGSGRYPKGSGKKNEIHFKVKEHKKSGEIVYTFKNDKNRKIGIAYVDKITNDLAELNWISIKNKYRGQGYAQKALQYIEKDVMNRKYKEIVLDALEDSPDAVHIYKKFGYTPIEKTKTIDNGLTLTKMKKRLSR